jgi:hypothetical protein
LEKRRPSAANVGRQDILFINFDQPYPANTFAALLSGSLNRFEVERASKYWGKTACVHGLIDVQSGKPQIVIKTLAELDLLDETVVDSRLLLCGNHLPPHHSQNDQATAALEDEHGCEGWYAVTHPGLVYGRVIDDAGEPLLGIGVLLLKADTVAARTTTLKDGHFVMTDLQNGEYALLIKHPGYVSRMVESMDIEDNVVSVGAVTLSRKEGE